MLIAECHGKVRAEVEDDEDYLTSAVFGHLRYVPASVFWGPLFAKAKRQDGAENLLAELGLAGDALSTDTRLRVEFWPRYPGFGEPDLILLFERQGYPTLVLLIEVKLWSGKSGEGENDQLGRYLLLLERILSEDSSAQRPHGALIYLTPRNSVGEISSTLEATAYRHGQRSPIFRLQWQDVLVVALQAATGAPEPAKTVLEDVARFLRRRGLEYFTGFHRLPDISDIADSEDRRFYRSAVMRRSAELVPFVPTTARWM